MFCTCEISDSKTNTWPVVGVLEPLSNPAVSVVACVDVVGANVISERVPVVGRVALKVAVPKSASVAPVVTVAVSITAVEAKTVAVIDLPDTLFPNASVAVTTMSCFVPAAPAAGADTVRLLINSCVCAICTSGNEEGHFAGIEIGACDVPMVARPMGCYLDRQDEDREEVSYFLYKDGGFVSKVELIELLK